VWAASDRGATIVPGRSTKPLALIDTWGLFAKVQSSSPRLAHIVSACCMNGKAMEPISIPLFGNTFAGTSGSRLGQSRVTSFNGVIHFGVGSPPSTAFVPTVGRQ
jgi:hypothetical protein